MIVPLLLTFVALIGLVFTVAVPEARGWTEPVALMLGLAILWMFAVPLPPLPQPAEDQPQPALRHVVIDGSNVMHWQDNTPQIEPVREVIRRLAAAGYTAGVIFDANAGYKLMGQYRHDYAFARMLGLPPDRVLVVAKGQPADPIILASAQHLGARIVSNDKFRDWAEKHPEIHDPGHLIRGGFRDGALWLDLI